MYELSWKDIIKSDNFKLVNMETGEIFDNMKYTIKAVVESWIYDWDDACGWRPADVIVG